MFTAVERVDARMDGAFLFEKAFYSRDTEDETPAQPCVHNNARNGIRAVLHNNQNRIHSLVLHQKFHDSEKSS